MKAVLLSIKPKYCELIANKKKTIEIRKSKPKLRTPFKCLIYCTKPKYPHEDYITIEPQCSYEDFISLDSESKKAQACRAFYGGGKVIGEFVCDGIIDLHDNGNEFVNPFNSEITELLMPFSCLSYKELHDYANGKQLYGWHISDLRIYDKPKELWWFYRPGFKPMEEFDDEELCGYCYKTNYGKNSFGTYPGGCWSCEGNWCEEAYKSYLEDEFLLTRPPQSWGYVEEL